MAERPEDPKFPPQPPLLFMLETQRWRKGVNPFSFILLFLYFPFGVVLCTLRILLFFIGFIALYITSFVRLDQFVYNIFYPLLGWIIITDRKVLQSPNRPRIIVCNHVSDYDGFALYPVVRPRDLTFITTIYLKGMATFAAKCGIPVSVIYRASGDDPSKKLEVRESIRKELEKGNRVLFVNAEGAETNGRVGLFRYNKFVFSLGMDILPLALKLSPPKWWPGNVEYSHDSFIRNLIYFFFTPYHIYRYHTLPVVRIAPGETDGEFADRVQFMTAKFLNLTPTQYTYNDKVRAFRQIR